MGSVAAHAVEEPNIRVGQSSRKWETNYMNERTKRCSHFVVDSQLLKPLVFPVFPIRLGSILCINNRINLRHALFEETVT